MVVCLACGRDRARVEEVGRSTLVFCDYVCQHAFYGVGQRALVLHDPTRDARFFRAEDRERLLMTRIFGRTMFPLNQAIYSMTREREWLPPGELDSNFLRVVGESAFEAGVSEAALFLARYRNPDDAPFLNPSDILLLKSVPFSGEASTPNESDAMAINEGCTGVRVASLFFSGQSRAFVPVIDFFPCACMGDLSTNGENARSFFVVQTVAERSVHVWEGLPSVEDARPPQVLHYVRSVLAQVLVALETAQYHIGFVHNDLHDQNVLLQSVDVEPAQVWMHRRPRDRGVVYFNPEHTNNAMVRIIDYGLSRADMPGNRMVNSLATFAREETRGFDLYTDMRVFAYQFLTRIVTVRPQWIPWLKEDVGLMGLLESMLGLAHWQSLAPPSGVYNIHVPRLGRSFKLSLPFGIERLLDFMNTVRPLRMRRNPPAREFGFMQDEIFTVRNDLYSAPTAGDILKYSYFESMTHPPEDDSEILVIGDATRDI